MSDSNIQPTLAAAAISVLNTAEARAKAQASRRAEQQWRDGSLAHVFDAAPPQRPARPAFPALLPPGAMPKRGRGGSLANRIALLHALAHIELNAIDLAWDVIARFGAGMPRLFCDDWVAVGDDEARHFLMLDDRLAALGSSYGALPAHDGLWQAALDTAGDLAARLAIVPLVLEARGLDVTPETMARLRRAGDLESAEILNRIYEDEIGHVAAGVRWFRHLCAVRSVSAEANFHDLVRRHFRGALKPPFNLNARTRADFPESFYMFVE